MQTVSQSTRRGSWLEPASSFAERRPWVVFSLIFCLSFAVRFALLTRGPIEPYVGETGAIAHSILVHHTFADPYAIPTGPSAHSSPFYPALLAGLLWIFGEGAAGGLARCIVLIAAYSLVYALFPALASRFRMPRMAGVLAGFAAALFPVKRSAEIFRGWEEPFAALAVAGILLLVLEMPADRAFRRWLLLGAATGGALYISAALAVIVVALGLLDLASHFDRQTVARWTAAAFVAVLIITPWTIRNRLVLGHWMFMRDAMGIALWYSNHEGARPSDELLVLRPESVRLQPNHNHEEALAVRQLGEVAYNQRETRLAMDWIAAHPRDFISLSLQRFVYFWFGPPQHPFDFLVTSSYTVLGFLGLAVLRRRCGSWVFRMWCAVLLVYPVTYYFVAYVSRYRVPIDWMVWLPAGLLVVSILELRQPILSSAAEG